MTLGVANRCMRINYQLFLAIFVPQLNVAFPSVLSVSLWLFYEFWSDEIWQNAGLVALRQEFANGFPAAGTEVERPVVYIHADESVGLARVEIAAKLKCVAQRLLAVSQAILNALFEQALDVTDCFGAEVLAHRICAKR